MGGGAAGSDKVSSVNFGRRPLRFPIVIGVMSDLYTGHFRLAAERLNAPVKAYEIIERARGRAVADVLRTLPDSDRRSTSGERSVQDHFPAAGSPDESASARRSASRSSMSCGRPSSGPRSLTGPRATC